MDLQNYTNVNIFTKVYEKREIVDKDNLIAHPQNHAAAAGPTKQADFNPYTNNYGTVIGKYLADFLARSRILTKFLLINLAFSNRWQRLLHGRC